jgi:hypothetical protein
VVNAHETRFDLRFTFGGALGPIVGRVASRTAQNYLLIEASSLKDQIESSMAFFSREV